mmetsp:Transcript_24750/g.60928  ORF Transcript_24750/g.60928 Transcript_24750/m.60928 type:complete len:587 (+) Transcript_24750:359-2119(+)
MAAVAVIVAAAVAVMATEVATFLAAASTAAAAMAAAAAAAAAGPGRTVTLAIRGMSCQHCVDWVHNALARVDGVRSAEVYLAQNTAVVTGTFNIAQLVRCISRTGYSARLVPAATAAAALGPFTLADLDGWDWRKADAGLRYIIACCFSSAPQLHALIDAVPELKSARRNRGQYFPAVSLHDEYDGGIQAVRSDDTEVLISRILQTGFGLLAVYPGSCIPMTVPFGQFFTGFKKPKELLQRRAVLRFLNMHLDIVDGYITGIFNPSDRGDKGVCAVLNDLWTHPCKAPPVDAQGFLSFCIGSHTVPVLPAALMHADTPKDIQDFTLALQSGGRYNSAHRLIHNGKDAEVDAVVKVMKHWNFPGSIWGALETDHKWLQCEFSSSPGFLICKVFVAAGRHVRLTVNESTEHARRLRELFCFFNSHNEGFSVECKALVTTWDSTAAAMARYKPSSASTMSLPEFQQIIKAVEKQSAAGAQLDADEAATLATVPLKPYQSQSVKFMSDAEQKPRGIQSTYWMELSPGDDESQPLSALFAPMTGEIILDRPDATRLAAVAAVLPPADVRGGFLLEAMGRAGLRALCSAFDP